DWLRLPATCHHNNSRLMELAEQFVAPDRKPKLFYLWGHSYEFERDNNWHVIEAFAEFISGHSDIWHATNIEIYDYIDAYNRLIFSMDGKKVYNPTALHLFFETSHGIYSVDPNKTIDLP
ncbi:MAG: polysaccharide deacetylase, partial [Peptococcaceae bacterium]|nr:polysaccharide deacetylase [Peptococcaceae bacterium]